MIFNNKSTLNQQTKIHKPFMNFLKASKLSKNNKKKKNFSHFCSLKFNTKALTKTVVIKRFWSRSKSDD